MTETRLQIWTFDWVPGGEKGPRGFVRDLRLRWACEEAGLAYDVRSVPFKNRQAEHYAHQPFGQVPILEDNGVSLFESGAALLHLAKKSEKLMPKDPQGEAETLQWTIAALNSIEMVTVPWWYLGLSNPSENPLESWTHSRLQKLDGVLADREYLAAQRFTVADLLMTDVLRIPKVRTAGNYPAIRSYVDRNCLRSAFQKAFRDQHEHFAKNDPPAP